MRFLSGQAVAEFLAVHPAVENIWYPGLKTHPGHEIAARQMKAYGGVLAFTLKGGRDETFRFIDALQIPFVSPSLGGTESLGRDLPILRELIVARMADRYHWQILPEDILFLPGVIRGFNMAVHALSEPNGGVFVQTPV